MIVVPFGKSRCQFAWAGTRAAHRPCTYGMPSSTAKVRPPPVKAAMAPACVNGLPMSACVSDRDNHGDAAARGPAQCASTARGGGTMRFRVQRRSANKHAASLFVGLMLMISTVPARHGGSRAASRPRGVPQRPFVSLNDASSAALLPWLCLSLSFILFSVLLSVSFSLSFSLCFSLCFSLPLSLCLSVPLSLCLSVPLSL